MSELKETVKAITDGVNTFSLDQNEFNSLMSKEHRTLQQAFTRLCVGWIKHCGSDEYRFDGRNEASHEFGKFFNEMENPHLPMI